MTSRSRDLRDETPGRLRGAKAQARRLRVWTRSPHCATCKRLTNYPDGFEADHIVPLFKGGKDNESNLQTLCVPCHEDKTRADLGQQVKVAVGLDGWPLSGAAVGGPGTKS